MIQIDMEMPNSCSECPICHCKGKDEPWNYCCFATMDDINIEEWDKERYITCPLKEVPTWKCKNCDHYRNGVCIWHSGFRPLEDWYCSDFMMVEEQQGENT